MLVRAFPRSKEPALSYVDLSIRERQRNLQRMELVFDMIERPHEIQADLYARRA